MNAKLIAYTMCVICLSVMLAGCSQSVATSATPCPTHVNTSPPTQTTDLMSIATDHSIYTPYSAIQITFVNHLAYPIDIFAVDAYRCTFLDLEQYTNGAWQQLAPCTTGYGDELPDTPVVGLEPNGIYQTSFSGGAVLQNKQAGRPVPFPQGTLRIMIHYKIFQPDGWHRTVTYSASFTIEGC